MLEWFRKLSSAKKEDELSEENPPPTHPDYEAFHVAADKDDSKCTADILMQAGIRIHQTVWNQIGHPEYVIEVHVDDLDKTAEAFWKDVGPHKTFTSTNAEPPDAPAGEDAAGDLLAFTSRWGLT